MHHIFRRQLSFSDAGAEDRGTFTCEATKDGKTASCDFEVAVIIPVTCTHEDGTEFEAGTTYNPNEVLHSSFFMFLENSPMKLLKSPAK